MIVTIDFETYWDNDYTLTKLSTSEYIRDPRFEALCASIKLGDKPTKTYWGHPAIQAALDEIDWKRNEVLAHHTHFEGLVLSHHFGVLPAKYLDTLSMARAIFPKTQRNDLSSLAERLQVQNKLAMPDFKGKRLDDLSPEERKAIEEYVDGDVESCSQAYVKLVEMFPHDELELINITVRMFADPVLKLDTALAKKELEREIAEQKEAIEGCGAVELLQAAGVEIKPKKKGGPIDNLLVLSSNKLFPQALALAGVEPPSKISKRTGKKAYALSKSDEKFTDLISHPDPKVSKLVRGRLAAKSTIGQTRAARLLRSGSRRQSLPVYLNYYGAHTGRWSGGDKLNYQNLKKKGDIRKAILAPKGYSLCVIDSSQIEARVVAWLAGEEWLIQAFREGRDVYKEFAAVAFNIPIGEVTKLQRFIAKTCVLGLGFQMGGPKLQKSLLTGSIQQGLDPVRLELDECNGLVYKYRHKNSKIEGLWGIMNNDVMHQLSDGILGEPRKYKSIEYGKGYIKLPNGLKLLYPGAVAKCTTVKIKGGLQPREVTTCTSGKYMAIEGETHIYGGYLTENVVQALARIIVAWQMLQIAKKYRIVMMTHDEVVFLVRTHAAEAALQWGLQIMRTPPEWCADLPVAAEGGHDVCYSK